ncbi:hypothetical protein ID866_4747 [Astraeus odoratus]|nr:hypothetical protein ID866_4747 [Astraeus odoratus]
MHPFGGTPVCPRCNKAVYAAEQVCARDVMGPGRKLYHKPCLACTACGKRLDSLTLLEHDQMPYCKTCHVRTFGIRDLRQANLPHREDLPPSPVPASPAHFGTASLVNVGSTSPARGGLHSPVRADFTGISGTTPLLRANSSLPTRFNRVSPTDPPPELTSTTEEAAEDGRLEKVEEQEVLAQYLQLYPGRNHD